MDAAVEVHQNLRRQIVLYFSQEEEMLVSLPQNISPKGESSRV